MHLVKREQKQKVCAALENDITTIKKYILSDFRTMSTEKIYILNLHLV